MTDAPALASPNRLQGRQPQAHRPVRITRGFTRYAPGSVLIELGETRVLVTASVEERVPRHIQTDKPEGHGWLTAEYSMLPGATHTRNGRERNHLSGRSSEIQRLIGRSLRASIDLARLGSRTITIDADVLQADGGTRVAAITGGYVALVDALRHLQAKGLLDTLPIIAPVAAISVGLVNDFPLLDLCYEEDFLAQVDANVIMNAHGEIIELQATAEDGAYSRQDLDTMLDLAWTGIQSLLDAQEAALAQPLLK